MSFTMNWRRRAPPNAAGDSWIPLLSILKPLFVYTPLFVLRRTPSTP